MIRQMDPYMQLLLKFSAARITCFDRPRPLAAVSAGADTPGPQAQLGGRAISRPPVTQNKHLAAGHRAVIVQVRDAFAAGSGGHGPQRARRAIKFDAAVRSSEEKPPAE